MKNSASEEHLFGLALAMPAAERAAFLDGACHGNPARRARLEALLAAANHEGRRVNFYDVASGRRLYSLPDEPIVIWWLAWHPDGRRLAVGRENGDISIWNLPEVEAAIARAGLAP